MTGDFLDDYRFVRVGGGPRQKEECRMKKGKMGSFFGAVSYARGINRCGYRRIRDHKMGSFGNFLFL